MTLNVTAIAPNFIVQASDRQISEGGHPTEEWNKAVAFVSPRLRLVVTYTGVARGRDGLETDMWIGERLGKAEFENAAVADIAEALASDATSRFRSIPKEIRHTIVTLAGWDRSAGDEPVAVQVENCLDPDGGVRDVRSSFAARALDLSRRVHVAGATDVVNPGDRRRIDRLIRCGRSERKLVASIVDFVRLAASKTSLVSQDCMTIVVQRSGGSPLATYHQANAAPVNYGPTVVVCGLNGATYIVGQPTIDYGSSEMEAKLGNFVIGDPSRGLGVRISKAPTHNAVRRRGLDSR